MTKEKKKGKGEERRKKRRLDDEGREGNKVSRTAEN